MEQDPPTEIEQEAEHELKALDRDFWSDHIRAYAFALDQQNARLETPSVLTTVPMWFGLLDPMHAQANIDKLAGPDHMTDWGMRILSGDDPRYDPSGYHFGSVWPLFTGWASVGEYRYHRPLPAYANLRANALLTLSGAPGRTTDVLSGSYFDSLLSSSPHQIWSSAMVVSPILRGMMGLEADSPAHALTFAPHVPASWNHFKLHNVWIGNMRCDLTYRHNAYQILLNADVRGGELKLHFSPAIALRASVLSVTVNGNPVKFNVNANAQDQHVEVDLHTAKPAVVLIRLKHDFDLEAPVHLPPPGQKSQGVRVISESWTRDHNTLRVRVSGLKGASYDFALRGAEQIEEIDGASLIRDLNNDRIIRVQFPTNSSEDYVSKAVVIHFKR